MTRVLLLTNDAEVRQAMPEHLRVTFPDWTVECVANVREAMDGFTAGDVAALVAWQPLTPVDTAALIVGATRAQPGKAVLSVTGGGRPANIEFLMLVQIPEAAHPFRKPFPISSVTTVLSAFAGTGKRASVAV